MLDSGGGCYQSRHGKAEACVATGLPMVAHYDCGRVAEPRSSVALLSAARHRGLRRQAQARNIGTGDTLGMAVVIQSCSVVVTNAALDRKFPGGAQALAGLDINASLCSDGRLSALSFLSTEDAVRFANLLASYGFSNPWLAGLKTRPWSMKMMGSLCPATGCFSNAAPSHTRRITSGTLLLLGWPASRSRRFQYRRVGIALSGE